MRRASTTLFVLLLACAEPSPDRAALLRETADDVIVPGYARAADEAAATHDAVVALCASPDAARLASAQAAWERGATAWRRMRATEVLGEPMIATTLDGALATRADVAAIDANIAGADILDAPDYVASLGGGAKGWLALEYVLFGYPGFAGRDDARTLTALSDARRCAYARVVAADVASVTARAARIWSPTGDDFASTFASGEPSAAYPYAGGALDDLVSTVATAVDRTRDEGVGRPLGLTMHASAVESPYAGASVTLMRATLDGVRDVWAGPPHGLHAMLRARSPELASRVLGEIDRARAAIDALDSPPLAVPWETYVGGTDHAAGEAAYDALAALETTLGTDVATTLGASVRVRVDGD